jgi:2,4-dienoyl-CoA reductase-like NADH-dependent reductase (Old Yellow Enzyme family)
VKESGFTGVQLHGAHGYLINQFLSPLSNLRTDRSGGSLETRMRFLIETFRAVRQTCGQAFPVSVKLNSADFLRGGFSEEDAIVVARTLDEEGIDLLEISGGTYEKPAMLQAPRESTTEREAHFLVYAREIRKHVRCPLMLTGGLRTPEVMARIVREGSADVIGLARPIALEPDLPRQILDGRTEPSACHPRRGAALVSAALDGSFYQLQLARMGRGLEPEARTSTLRALGRSVCGHLFAPRST